MPGPQPNWFDNDTLFLNELKTGHDFARLAAGRLRQGGLTVEVTPMEVRETIHDRGRFADEHDLTVGVQRPCRIDVKSRRLEFTCAMDYPHHDAIVDTVSGWERKTHKPLAIILVSQITEAMVVVAPSTRPSWYREWLRDGVRGITDRFFMVPRGQLRPVEDLIDWLAAREAPLALVA